MPGVALPVARRQHQHAVGHALDVAALLSVEILAELDGSVFDRPIAAFRIIPYFAREFIALPPLDDFIDISTLQTASFERSGAR